MLMPKSSKIKIRNLKHSPMVSAFLFLMGLVLGAKLDLDFGGLVSFTLQTLFLGLAYYYLPTKWRLAAILIYLALGILGVPVFNGGVGWSYFISFPLGFFIGFVLAAMVPRPSTNGLMSVFIFMLQIHAVIVVAGIVGIAWYSGSYITALETAMDILPGAVIKSAVGAAVVLGVNRFKVSIKSNNSI